MWSRKKMERKSVCLIWKSKSIDSDAVTWGELWKKSNFPSLAHLPFVVAVVVITEDWMRILPVWKTPDCRSSYCLEILKMQIYEMKLFFLISSCSFFAEHWKTNDRVRLTRQTLFEYSFASTAYPIFLISNQWVKCWDGWGKAEQKSKKGVKNFWFLSSYWNCRSMKQHSDAGDGFSPLVVKDK